MRILFSICLLALLTTTNAMAQSSHFFANQDIQAQMPQAFVLQPAAASFLQAFATVSTHDGDALVQLIQSDPELQTAVNNWAQLSWEQRIPVLQKIFMIECGWLNRQ